MDRTRKIILIIFFMIVGLRAEQVEIVADSFFADENKQVTEFIGNVHIKKGSYDELKAAKVVVNFDKNRQPIKYTATTNANFKVFMREKHYEGKGDILTYEPNKEIYTITGNGHLKEIDTDKNVYGEKITIDQKNGTYNVGSGSRQPVKFIFHTEEKKK